MIDLFKEQTFYTKKYKITSINKMKKIVWMVKIKYYTQYKKDYNFKPNLDFSVNDTNILYF